jgi:hypothetical protein
MFLTAGQKLTWYAALLPLVLLGASNNRGGGYTTLDPPGSAQTYAYGISGNFVVGAYNPADAQYWPPYGPPKGFLYNASTGAYLTLEVPGAYFTEAYHISGNNVVGRYDWDHAFLFDGAQYKPIDPPGAGVTNVMGVSGNNVVGNYWMEADAWQAFLYDNEQDAFATLVVPGSMITRAVGVSGNNVAGEYWDAAGTFHGFFYDGSRYITLDCPKAKSPNPLGDPFVYFRGVSGNNVVGYYQYNYDWRGFLYTGSNGNWKTLVANGSGETEAIAVSGKNVVGNYWDDFGGKHGFFYNGANSTTLDPPGSVATECFGVSGNKAVGYYEDAAGARHGFLYVAP